MHRALIIYHGGRCLDGFGSAFAAYRRFGAAADYRAANHGEPPPAASGRDVYILDFSYPRPVLAELCRQAARVVVLDHHISAQENLTGLDREHANLELVFDMHRSGAVISWEYFHPEPPPRLLLHVQDRDLWQSRLPTSREITTALMAHPFDFALWETLAASEAALERLTAEGAAIGRYLAQEIELYRDRAVMGEIAGHRVPIVNAPLSIRSELLNVLAQGQPFAAGYMDKGSQRVWSLRSTPAGLDVAKIAALFGGGGHVRAAGFATETSAELLSLVPPSR